jgi:flagellar basal-body rod protein FlgF
MSARSRRTGASLYEADGQVAQAVPQARVSPGFIERSNVEPVIEISRMIELMRAYQASADLTKSAKTY